MTKSDSSYIKMTVEELLPKSFGPHSLQEERLSPDHTEPAQIDTGTTDSNLAEP